MCELMRVGILSLLLDPLHHVEASIQETLDAMRDTAVFTASKACARRTVDASKHVTFKDCGDRKDAITHLSQHMLVNLCTDCCTLA